MNNELREYVTSVGFQLSLTRNQMAGLIYLNEALEKDWSLGVTAGVSREVINSDPIYRGLNQWSVTMHSLCRRGLIEHHNPGLPPGDILDHRLHAFYSMTTAGELVCGLLREAGLYGEILGKINKLRSLRSKV